MRLVRVGLCQRQIALAHRQSAVSQQHLQYIDVSAIAQELDRKCMPEAVRVRVGHARPLTQAAQHLQQIVAV